MPQPRIRVEARRVLHPPQARPRGARRSHEGARREVEARLRPAARLQPHPVRTVTAAPADRAHIDALTRARPSPPDQLRHRRPQGPRDRHPHRAPHLPRPQRRRPRAARRRRPPATPRRRLRLRQYQRPCHLSTRGRVGRLRAARPRQQTPARSAALRQRARAPAQARAAHRRRAHRGAARAAHGPGRGRGERGRGWRGGRGRRVRAVRRGAAAGAPPIQHSRFTIHDSRPC